MVAISTPFARLSCFLLKKKKKAIRFKIAPKLMSLLIKPCALAVSIASVKPPPCPNTLVAINNPIMLATKPTIKPIVISFFIFSFRESGNLLLSFRKSGRY